MKHLSLLFFITIFLSACFPTINLLGPQSASLQEVQLDGKGKDKILVISIDGIIKDKNEKNLFHNKPGLLSESLAQLQKARKDKDIKAVILRVDSPGGSVGASDILYYEIAKFKKDLNIPLIVSISNMGSSGAYYISLPADKIIAHPTSITGSVGVIFVRAKSYELMDKIGLSFEINKSGENKDIGSPLRKSSKEEEEYFQAIIDKMAERFYSLVEKHRDISEESMKTIKKAGIYTAEEALKLGLIDEIGYMDKCIKEAKKLAGIEKACSIISYKREAFSDTTIYTKSYEKEESFQAINLKLPVFSDLNPGFYYLSPLLLSSEY